MDHARDMTDKKIGKSVAKETVRSSAPSEKGASRGGDGGLFIPPPRRFKFGCDKIGNKKHIKIFPFSKIFNSFFLSSHPCPWRVSTRLAGKSLIKLCTIFPPRPNLSRRNCLIHIPLGVSLPRGDERQPKQKRPKRRGCNSGRYPLLDINHLGQQRGEGSPGGRAALGGCGVSAAWPRGSPPSAPGGRTRPPPARGPGSPAKSTMVARGAASKHWLARIKRRTGGKKPDGIR